MFLARRRFTAHTYALKNTAVKVNRQRRACGSKLVAAFFFSFFFFLLSPSFSPRAIFPLAMHVAASPSNISFLPPFFFPLPTRSSEAGSSLEADSKSVKPAYSRVTSPVASRSLKAFRRHRHRRETNANTSITRYRGLWLRNERPRLHPGLASRRLFDSNGGGRNPL